MAKPKIGNDYRLDVKSDLYDEAIPWVNNSSRKLFQSWREIEGRIVRVKAETHVMTTFYIVALLEYPKDSFYTPRKMLMEITRRLPLPCGCPLTILLNRGCQCGVFKKEQNQKKS